MKLQLNLTGKMGKRTKFQTFETAQLIAEAYEEDDPLVQKLPDVKDILKQETALPFNQPFEEDSILLEKPQIDSLNVKQSISVQSQIIILSLVNYLKKSQSQDEIVKEQIKSYLELVADFKFNWLTTSQVYLLRSLNEFGSIKRMERTIMQMDSLVSQFNDHNPKIDDRMTFFWSVNYSNIFNLVRLLSYKFVEIGMVMSALQLFERLNMHTDVVECLMMADRNKEAKEKALAQKDFEQNPKLLCLFGDMCQDISYYKKAWKVSNKRFAKAKKSLGRYHFYQKDFKKAISAFKKALKINSYDQKIWYILGCAYLQCQMYKEAVHAFSSCVQIDETNGETWANLSTSFKMLGKKKEAQSTLERGLNYSENNWRMWMSLTFISLENLDFSKFLTCLERLVQLQRKDLIDSGICAKINQVFEFQLKLYRDETITFRRLQFMKNKIDRVCQLIKEEIGQKYYVWDFMANQIPLQLEFVSILNALYSGGTEEQRKTLPKEEFDFRKNVRAYQDQKYDYLLNSCQCQMVTGWEKEKQNCEILEIQAQKLIEAYFEGDALKDGQKLKVFLETIVPNIEAQLGRASELRTKLKSL